MGGGSEMVSAGFICSSGGRGQLGALPGTDRGARRSAGAAHAPGRTGQGSRSAKKGARGQEEGVPDVLTLCCLLRSAATSIASGTMPLAQNVPPPNP